MNFPQVAERDESSDGKDEWKAHHPASVPPASPPPMASYPDLAVEDLVIDVLIEALLWIHLYAVSLQVFLDLGTTHR